MPLILFTFITLFGVSINTANSGKELQDLSDIKESIVVAVENKQPLDYSKLND